MASTENNKPLTTHLQNPHLPKGTSYKVLATATLITGLDFLFVSVEEVSKWLSNNRVKVKVYTLPRYSHFTSSVQWSSRMLLCQ